MVQRNVSGDEIPKTLQELLCAADVTIGITYQLTWLSGLNIFLSITAVLGNTLILVALRRETSLHPPSKLLFRCLSTTDLCVGLLSQPMYAAYEISLLNGRRDACRYTFVTSFIAGYILSGVSLFTPTAISVDRLLALLLGLRYRLIVTLRRTVFIVIVIWILAIVCSTLYFWNYRISLAYAYVCTSICLVTSIFSYTKIFFSLRHLQTQVQDLINQQASPTSPMNMARYRKAVTSALWLQLALVACYLPHGVMSALHSHSDQSSAASFGRNFTATVVFLNSTLNPIVYCWKIREVRQAAKETIRHLWS